MTETYDNYWTARASTGNRYRYNVFVKWIPARSEVLDVGCGDGFLGGRLIAERQCTVTGMDVSSVALERAKARGLTGVQGSLDARLPFADKQFDYVIASEVLEHIIHSEEAFDELCRIARKGVILSVPNSAYWEYRWQLLMGHAPKQWLKYPWEHLRFWSIAEFVAMIESRGQRVAHTQAGSGRRWLRDWLPSLFAEQVCYLIPIKTS